MRAVIGVIGASNDRSLMSNRYFVIGPPACPLFLTLSEMIDVIDVFVVERFNNML